MNDLLKALGHSSDPRRPTSSWHTQSRHHAKPHPDYDMADWVLSDIPKEQRPLFAEVVGNATMALELILKGEFDLAMNKYN